MKGVLQGNILQDKINKSYKPKMSNLISWCDFFLVERRLSEML